MRAAVQESLFVTDQPVAEDEAPRIPAKRTSPPPISGLTTRKVIAFGWYGGKFSHLEWLLPLLPTCHHYCEPFAGSGAVLLNRPPSPVETYNDLDGEVVNFFRVLRQEKDRLIEAIGLTPFSREEFMLACQLDPAQPPLERARRFYVRARQVRRSGRSTFVFLRAALSDSSLSTSALSANPPPTGISATHQSQREKKTAPAATPRKHTPVSPQ